MSTLRRFLPTLALTFAVTVSGTASRAATIASSASATIDNASTNFENGTFGGWTVDGSKTGGFGVAADGTSFGGTYDVFGAMSVNARSGGNAAYALVSSVDGEALKMSQTFDLAAGTYEIGYYLGATAAGRPNGPSAFSGIGNAILVNGTSPGLLVSGAIPNGTTDGDFQLFKTTFTTLGGPTTIDLKVTGSGFGRALISLDDIYLTRLQPEPQEVPEPAAIVVIGLGFAGTWVARRRRARRI